MDTSALSTLQLFVFVLCAKSLMISGFSGENPKKVEGTSASPKKECNETAMLLDVNLCGNFFEQVMYALVDPKNWCNLTHVIGYYNTFSECTEVSTMNTGCFWPNPLVEGFIIGIHKEFFSNCTYNPEVIHEDPPDNILGILILIPVFLTAAMIALVVWCSRRSDILV